ncbi:MAG: hypothetical protein ABIR05_02410 [Luteimonas sp.]
MELQPRVLKTETAANYDARTRRLCVLSIVVALLLGTYVGALSWVTRQVENGVDRSLQPIPLVMRDQPGG